jgi:membrane protein implicated in regulation of membrane protease activity
MDDAVRLALTAGAVVFALMVLLPIASFLLKAAIVAALAMVAVYIVARMLGR